MAKKAKVSKLKKTYPMQLWQIATFVVIFAGVGVYAIVSSQAAPRGGAAKATLSISPNPLSANKSTQISLSGCGYNADPYTITNVGIQKDGWGAFGYNAGVNPDGCLSTTPYPTNIDENNSFSLPAGTYRVTIKQAIGGKVPKNPNAETTLIVR